MSWVLLPLPLLPASRLLLPSLSAILGFRQVVVLAKKEKRLELDQAERRELMKAVGVETAAAGMDRRRALAWKKLHRAVSTSFIY